MALTSPPTAVAPFDKGRLNAGIDATATTLHVAPIFKTVNGVRVKQGINTESGCAIISAGDFTELVTYTGRSVDATTKVTTITGLTRGRDPTQTTASNSFAGGTGKTWSKGAKFTVVADATYFQSGVFTNVANTFTANQTLSGTNELRFADSATAIWDDGTDLNFKSSTTAAKTLAELAAAAGTDEKTKVSINDTTGDYLLNKLAAGTGITLTETNDGGDEDVTIATVNTVATGHTGLSTVTTGGLLVGAGTSNMTIIGPGTSGQVPISNGTTIAMGTVPSNKTRFVPVENMRMVTSAAVADNNSSSGLRFAASQFDQTTQEFAYFMWALPDDYVSGTISVKFCWVSAVNTTNSVVWGITLTALTDGDDINAVTEGTQATVADAGSASANTLYKITAATTCTIANTPAAGKMVLAEVSRVTGDASDTYAGDAGLMGVFLTYS